MNNIFLSICIPTYNRCDFLKQNIGEIIKQILDFDSKKIEICISDNASTDNTENYINFIKDQFPNIIIKYRKNEKNLGSDWNFYYAMNMAQGKFSWLIGSDDVICANAINRLFDILERTDDIDILLFNRINCDINMHELAENRQKEMLRNDIESRLFDFNDIYQEKYYYSICQSLGGVFSYISSIIYKTEAVDNEKFDESYIGTAYAHLFYFINYLRKGKRLFYLNESLVKCRLGNDSFGIGYKRILLDFEGYHFVADKIFQDDNLKTDFLSVLKQEHKLQRILYIYTQISNNKWNNEFKPLLLTTGWSIGEIEFIEKMGNTPNWFISKFKQRVKKILLRK